MDDWAKTLISSGFGFVAGLLTEPIKLRITNHYKTQSAREALYSDMGRVYHLLSRCFDVAKGPGGFENTSLEDQGRATGWIRAAKLDVFSFYSTSERAVFFAVPDYQGITEAYESVGLALRSVASPWPERYAAAMNVFQTFERLFKRGALDSKLLLKWRAKHREKTVTQITQFHQLEAQGQGGIVRDNQYVGGSVPRVFKPKD